MNRCNWANTHELFFKYHDNEWGVPLYDDQKLFEFLVLETFQSGLSWAIVLKKRENFRKAFDQFDYTKVAKYDAKKLFELTQNEGIIRNKLKIKATVNNANAFIGIQKEFGSFSHYIWSFVNHTPIQNNFTEEEQIPAKTPLSDKLSVELKKRGFTFIGSTVMYAHMQATGMVNDHTINCFRHKTLDNS